MRKTTIVWLMIAASLMLVGCILFLCVMSTWAKYETNTYEADEAFSDRSITTDTPFEQGVYDRHR